MARITNWTIGDLAGVTAMACTVTEVPESTYCKRCGVAEVCQDGTGYCIGCTTDIVRAALLEQDEYADAMAEIYADQDKVEKGLY
jgi:hypothetical protein